MQGPCEKQHGKADRMPDALAGIQADDAAEVLAAVKAAQHVDAAVQVGSRGGKAGAGQRGPLKPGIPVWVVDLQPQPRCQLLWPCS